MRRLLREHPGVLQRKQRAFGVEHAHVVGRTQLVHLVHQGLRAQHVAQAHAGQAEFGQRAHEQHVGVGHRVGPNLVEPGLAGKRLVGLVHHHQPAKRGRFGDQATDHGGVPQIGGGVVRIGDVGDGGPVRAHRGQHGGLVQLKAGRERHTVESQALQLRAHGVHDKTGQRREDGCAGHVAGHGQQGDQLVRAVAQHQAMAFGQVHVAGQRLLEIVDACTWVAVDRHRAQALSQLCLQLGRERKRIFHRIELDQTGRVLDGVGVHGLDVLPDEAQRVRGVHVGHRAPRIGGTLVRRNSAARACACRPSP
ncbi:hypothetical protein FQZ97_855150 [compost metagenome]